MNKLIFCLLSLLVSSAFAGPWPGKKSDFHSFDQYDFMVKELNCKIVVPKEIAVGKPWIWRARFFGHEPQTDIALLEKGFHVAYVDVAGLYGAPKAVKRWEEFYQFLTTEHQFSKKAALEGMSRGGLIIYNFAAKHPDKISCIYADAPVCDFKSWPKIGPEILAAYDLTEGEARAYQGNPVDNLKPPLQRPKSRSSTLSARRTKLSQFLRTPMSWKHDINPSADRSLSSAKKASAIIRTACRIQNLS